MFPKIHYPSTYPHPLSALNIIRPLPAEIYITKGDDVDLSVKIEGTIESEDELTVTLYNSLRGLDTDLSKHLKWDITPVPNMPDQYEFEATLPYPYSLNAGDLRLTIANENGADDTETVLNIEEMGSEDPPFFDPAPTDIKSYPNNNIMLETRVRGSRPVKIDWFVTQPGSGTPQPIIEGDGDKYEIHINGSLTIKDVGEEDEGTYLVQVSNSAGSATEEAEIEVTQTAGLLLNAYCGELNYFVNVTDCQPKMIIKLTFLKQLKSVKLYMFEESSLSSRPTMALLLSPI